jgi:hypothetical protein
LAATPLAATFPVAETPATFHFLPDAETPLFSTFHFFPFPKTFQSAFPPSFLFPKQLRPALVSFFPLPWPQHH